MSASPKSALPLATAEVLASVAQHRVLSTPQIQAIHFEGSSMRWAQMVLARLEGAGLLAFVPMLGVAGTPRRLWHVTQRGARAALSAGALERMPRLFDGEAASGPLQAHTLAVNDAAICFMAAARERGDDFGPLAWRHEVPHRLGPRRRAGTLFADAVLTYLRLTESAVVVEQRFLELDRASLSVDRLAAELGSYARFLQAENEHGDLLWESQYPSFPPVLCVLAGGTRAVLERRRDTTVAILQADPRIGGAAGLSIRLCLAEDLSEAGPFAPIFTDVRAPETPVNWLMPEPSSGSEEPST